MFIKKNISDVGDIGNHFLKSGLEAHLFFNFLGQVQNREIVFKYKFVLFNQSKKRASQLKYIRNLKLPKMFDVGGKFSWRSEKTFYSLTFSS